jgi:hypothetical protein
MKKAIFTCLFGEYDNLNPAPSFKGWDCFLFTDKIPEDARGWIVLVQSPWADSKKQSRHYKILSHIFLPDYELVCYVDANIVLLKEPPSRPIWGKHYSGRTIMQEARQILNLNKEDKTIIDRQMIYYSRHKIKSYPPLMQNGFFVREHSHRINTLHDAWWEQVKEFSYRDQLSLPFVMAKTDIHVQGISSSAEINRYFKIAGKHIFQQKKLKPSVHHITAGRADKNIGKAINDIVKGLPDGDWICYRDIDTIPMSHESFFKQCEEIAERGDFTLVGCITNRLGLERQLYRGEISSNPDILYHRKIATELYEKHGSQVKKVNGGIAGIMMLFSKNLWKSVGGFEEGYIVHPNGNFFDYEFCKKAKTKGAKIGVADGIYLFHFYRFGAENPKISTKHLY